MADPLEEEQAAEEEKARILEAIRKADLEEPGDWIRADSPVSSDTEVESEDKGEEEQGVQPPWPKTPPSSPPPPADAPLCGGGGDVTPPDLPFLPTHYCAGCNNTFIGKVIRLLDDDQHFGEYCTFQCVVDHLRQEHAN
jgi:hypothetical protein